MLLRKATCPLTLTLAGKAPQTIEKVIRGRNYIIKTLPLSNSEGIDRVIVVLLI